MPEDHEVDGLPVPVMDALLRGALKKLLPPAGRELVAAEVARQLPKLPAAIKRRL